MPVIEVNSENFEKEVKNSDFPVIIDFYADWCGPCQMMKPVFEALSKDYKGKLKFAKLNTDESPDIAEEFNVEGIPCLVIIKNGKEVDRIIGFNSQTMLKQKIDKIIK